MTFQRVAFTAAVFLLAQNPQDVSGFSVSPLTSTRSVAQSTTAIRMSEPSASEKAAELRKKAEAAKARATELKKVAEQKAATAMKAVKAANDRRDAIKAEAKKPEPEPKRPVPPKAPAATANNKASTRIVNDPLDGAIVPINSDTIEFTSGVLGGALALALGASPVFAVVAAAAANYISKKDDWGELNEFMQGMSKASLYTFNWFGKLDSKYTILGKLTQSLDKSIDDLKNGEGASAETVKKIEEITKQITQLADEIDLIEGSKQALGAVGDVVETSIDKAIGVNKEYNLTGRAGEAAKKAVDKAKERK